MPDAGDNYGKQTAPIILLIEDETADVLLFRRALEELNFLGGLHEVGSVNAARAYLEGTPPFNNRSQFPLPDLIISDMNLPGANGYDFLEWLRKEEKYCDVPFLFFSGSFALMDKGRANELGVLLFAKTMDMTVMIERVQSMLTLLPRGPGSPGS